MTQQEFDSVVIGQTLYRVAWPHDSPSEPIVVGKVTSVSGGNYPYFTVAVRHCTECECECEACHFEYAIRSRLQFVTWALSEAGARRIVETKLLVEAEHFEEQAKEKRALAAAYVAHPSLSSPGHRRPDGEWCEGTTEPHPDLTGWYRCLACGQAFMVCGQAVEQTGAWKVAFVTIAFTDEELENGCPENTG